MSIVSFLYRYIFRRMGLVLLIGIITILILAFYSQKTHAKQEYQRTPPQHAITPDERK